MKRPDNLEQVKNRIQDAKDGSVFIPSDFFNIAEAVKINMCLDRLEETGELQRMMRGIYVKPRYSALLNKNIPPQNLREGCLAPTARISFKTSIRRAAMNRIAKFSHREREDIFLATAHDINARYDLTHPGTMRLMPPEDCVPILTEDYEHMKNMIFGTKPSLEEIMGTLRRMEAEINALA